MRVTNNVPSRNRRKAVLKQTRGYQGARGRLIRMAMEALDRAQAYATAHRRKRKGDFRRQWNSRISIAVQSHGLSYSRFIHLLSQKNVVLNRKMLSELSIQDASSFSQFVEWLQSE